MHPQTHEEIPSKKYQRWYGHITDKQAPNYNWCCWEVFSASGKPVQCRQLRGFGVDGAFCLEHAR